MIKQLRSAFAYISLCKRPIKTTVLTIMSLLALHLSFAQQWNIIGNEGQISAVTSNFTSITVLDNIPHVVYVEGTTTPTTGGIGKVKKRNASTDTWDQVGSDLGSNVVYTRIYSDKNNKLYVTFVDINNNSRLAVLTFNAATQAWEPLVAGNPYVSTSTVNLTTTGSTFNSTPRSGLTFDSNNIPYITFSERSTGYPYVKNFVNGAWQTIGGASVSTDFALGNNIALDNNDVPYTVYTQQSALTSTTGAIKVYRFNTDTNAWENVSPPSPVLPGSSTTGATTGVRHTSIAMDSTFNPIVSYFNTGNSNKSTIIRYNKANATWNYIGAVSSKDAPYNCLVRDNGGNVYNAFTDLITAGTQIKVFKLNYGNPAFIELKSATSTGGIDNGFSLSAINIAIGSDTSKPFIIYLNTNSSGVVTPIVQIFSRPVFTKAITNITTTSATTGGEVTSDGISTIIERGVVYGLNANPTTTDKKLADGSGGIGSYTTTITGLSIAVTYHVRAYTVSSTGTTTYGNDVVFSTNPPDAGSVTVVDNGTSVTMKNAKVSVTINKSNATITNLTYNGQNLLNGGYSGGSLYWSWNMGPYQQPSGCTYSLTADPHSNNFNYAEIKLHMLQDSTATTAALDMDIYYSLPRDTSGIYASATLRHPASYNHANPGGEWRMAGYPGSTFNWLSVDSMRNKLMALNNDWGTPTAIAGAPPENMLLTTGIKKNQYECKYDYSADFGEVDAWGWSSTTDNVGLWMTAPSKEYYNGGPMKRELMCHSSPTILNMLGGQHYGMGDEGGILANENWEKTFGPFLIYCNSVPAGTANAPIALWKDAVAQAKEEQTSWPYSWYTNPSYIQESGRGTITGKLSITDPGAQNASAANMWVGVAIPPTNATSSDFQHWSKNYQFWVKTDANGNFTIPHVLASNTPYNLYAFGPGANGQLTLVNYVTVTAKNTNALGTINWTPTRVAATIWEIGTPDRSAKEFFHGNDWWKSDTTVGNTAPAAHWAKFQDYPTEFPNGVNFTIGQSNIATDWNYVMNYDNTVQTTSPVWTVNFNLTTDPTTGSTASIYTALATNFGAALIATVNGKNITSPTTGTVFGSKADAMIRMGIHGAFAETRFSFPASNLHVGANTITFTERITGGGTNGDLMLDYVRLEADGTGTTVLPVTFGTVEAYQNVQGIQVDWTILTEANIKAYEVERSADGQTFIKIGTVAAKGNSNIALMYGLLDVSPNNGNNFYRIKSIGINGLVQYSKIVKVVLTGFGNSNLVIYPNPIIGNVINLQMNNFEKGNYILTLTNQLGQQVFSQTITNNGVSSGQNIMLDKVLAVGIYQLKLSDNDKVVTQKVVKE